MISKEVYIKTSNYGVYDANVFNLTRNMSAVLKSDDKVFPVQAKLTIYKKDDMTAYH